uniref:Mitochondrial import inner membrane translocase subunit TIM44 n=1 Tax=Bactrocera latifrons TaxID=174628 RepID=A0A0K8UZ67_BACLA
MYKFFAASRGNYHRFVQSYSYWPGLHNQRCYSQPSRRPGFFSQFIDNIRSEIDKNKEMKENIKKFREEAQKLEQSEALQSARQKFNIVESEAQKSSNILKEQLGSIKDKVSDVIDEASKSDIAKKATKLSEEISKTAKGVTETITEKSEKIGQTSAFQAISTTTEIIKQEIGSQSINSRVYRSPQKLRKRIEVEYASDERVVEPNADATGIKGRVF